MVTMNIFDDVQYRLLVRPLTDAYPEELAGDEDQYSLGISDYDPLLSSMGFEIALRRDDDGYQGDSRLILRHGSLYGLLFFSWGSCSGCDRLQACKTVSDLEDLRRQLFNSIQWGSADELRDLRPVA